MADTLLENNRMWYVPTGNNVRDRIAMPSFGCLRGWHPSRSVIKSSASSTGELVGSIDGAVLDSPVVMDLTIVGDGVNGNALKGIAFESLSAVILSVALSDFNGYAISVKGNRHSFRGVTIRDCANGIELLAADDPADDCYIDAVIDCEGVPLKIEADALGSNNQIHLRGDIDIDDMILPGSGSNAEKLAAIVAAGNVVTINGESVVGSGGGGGGSSDGSSLNDDAFDIPFAYYLGASNAEYRSWLASQERYRDTPIYTTRGGLLSSGGFTNPYVASEAMCVQPAVDGGNAAWSPNALICDKWSRRTRFTTSTTVTLTAGSPTANLTVSALPYDLPKGLGLTFGSGYVVLTTAAAAGATTINVGRINANVTITSGETATYTPSSTFRDGNSSFTMRDTLLLGNPNPVLDSSSWTSTKYACDGFSGYFNGLTLDNVIAAGFPGHGFYLTYSNLQSQMYGYPSPIDFVEVNVGLLRATRCLTGITLASTDPTARQLITKECRDVGVRILGSAAQIGSVHAYGCGAGMYGGAGFDFDCALLETENCNYGTHAGGSETKIGILRAFTNAYVAFRATGSRISLGAANITHASTANDGFDASTTGMAVAIGSYCDYSNFRNMQVVCSGAANGVYLGHYTPKTLTECTWTGNINGGSGIGLRVVGPFSGGVIAGSVSGFSGGGFYVNNAGVLLGSRIELRGPSATTIRWADGTTGTFGTPNIPSAVSNNNYASILPY